MNKNTKTLLSVLAIVFTMIGLAFASVPLYDMFCRVTGFGGTTQISTAAPAAEDILERQMTVRFTGNTNRALAWRFAPERRQITLPVGQQGFINFTAENRADVETVGTAVYNVTPAKAGKYFHKTQCFCFDEQALKPGEQMNMPVAFYIDPSIAQDRSMDDVQSITLSYSFFKSGSIALDQALEAFYNSN